MHERNSQRVQTERRIVESVRLRFADLAAF